MDKATENAYSPAVRGGSRIEFTRTGDRADQGGLHAADAVIDAWSYR
jgi:hypothetical protein